MVDDMKVFISRMRSMAKEHITIRMVAAIKGSGVVESSMEKGQS